jgi:putative membrane protein
MMNGLLVRLAITSVGLWLASAIVPGIAVDAPATLILAAILLGVVNAIVRPIAIVLTIPITILSLGLFLWVINAAMLGLVAWLLEGFHIAGLGSALLGALIVSLTGWVASLYIGDRGRFEVIVFEDR